MVRYKQTQSKPSHIEPLQNEIDFGLVLLSFYSVCCWYHWNHCLLNIPQGKGLKRKKSNNSAKLHLKWCFEMGSIGLLCKNDAIRRRRRMKIHERKYNDCILQMLMLKSTKVYILHKIPNKIQRITRCIEVSTSECIYTFSKNFIYS